jgi:hypothetical protein
MRFPRMERIQPVNSAQMEAEGAAGRYVFDTKRYHRGTGIESRCNFIENLARRIRRSCEKHNDHMSRGDRIDHRIIPSHSGFDVSGRNPASDARRLQVVAHGVGHRFVVVRVAYENVVSQRIAPNGLRR